MEKDEPVQACSVILDGEEQDVRKLFEVSSPVWFEITPEGLILETLE